MFTIDYDGFMIAMVVCGALRNCVSDGLRRCVAPRRLRCDVRCELIQFYLHPEPFPSVPTCSGLSSSCCEVPFWLADKIHGF